MRVSALMFACGCHQEGCYLRKVLDDGITDSDDHRDDEYDHDDDYVGSKLSKMCDVR